MSERMVLGCFVCVLGVLLSGCSGGGTTAPAVAAPILTSVMPTEGPASGGTTLTLTGANFTAVTAVTVGGNPATEVQGVDDTVCTCRTPPGTAGARVDVEVTTAGGTDSLAAAFLYLHPAPTLTAVSPTSGTASGGTVITLTGTGFSAGGVSVTVGGTPATGVSVVGDTTVRCTTPPGIPGTVSVAVTTDRGTATLPGAFTYLDLLLGTYHYAAFLGDYFEPAGTGVWGTVTADGMGMVVGGTLTQITNGTLDGPNDASPFPYAIDTARRIDLDSGAGKGGISPDGSVAAVATVESGIPPALVFLLRREGSFSTASLNGTYHLGAFWFNGSANGAFWGSITFDGAGTATNDMFRNMDGQVDDLGSQQESYSVASDGTVTCELRGLTFQGGVLEGGDLAILSGGTADGDVSLIMVLIRQSTVASEATLSGSYHVVQLVAAGLLGGWTSYTGTATANGAGTLTNEGGVVNSDGGIDIQQGGGSLTYAIVADGTATITAGAEECQGGVSPDGRFLFWTGSTTGGEVPQLWFLWR